MTESIDAPSMGLNLVTSGNRAMLLADEGAIFYVSHSGGKDSQAMYAILSRIIPSDQIVVVHADLGEVEWDGVQDHIRDNVAHEVNVVRAGKTFFDMVRRRHEMRPEAPSWPSASTRQCTSDLKRDPIHKFIRHDLKARGKTLAVNCTGIRAAESSARRRKDPFRLNARLSKAGREVYEWMPIFDLSDGEVFQVIHDAGEKPFWAYKDGNERLSCVFCIMGCPGDLRHGAKVRPDLYEKYVALEEEVGYTMFHKKSLREVVEDE